MNNQKNINQNTGKEQPKMTRPYRNLSLSSSSNQLKMSPYLKNIYNGEHQNFMYFHEYGNKERRIAVVFTYNYQTGRGDYTAAMWYYDPKANMPYVSWNKAKHRQTAQSRYEIRDHIHFQIPFQICQDDFQPELRQVIRNTIRHKGLSGSRLDLLSQERLSPQPSQIEIGVNVSSEPASQVVLMQSTNKRRRPNIDDTYARLGEYLH